MHVRKNYLAKSKYRHILDLILMQFIKITLIYPRIKLVSISRTIKLGSCYLNVGILLLMQHQFPVIPKSIRGKV